MITPITRPDSSPWRSYVLRTVRSLHGHMMPQVRGRVRQERNWGVEVVCPMQDRKGTPTLSVGMEKGEQRYAWQSLLSQGLVNCEPFPERSRRARGRARLPIAKRVSRTLWRSYAPRMGRPLAGIHVQGRTGSSSTVPCRSCSLCRRN